MQARLTFNRDYSIADTDDRLYGAFIEHMGRCVYGGIYQPSHPCADNMGFRTDVMRFVKALRVPLIRYPGGNFVSNYNWEDGVGPVEKRPRTADAAWQSVEPNLIGTDEFHAWAERAGSAVMMAVNLGTGDITSARNLVEYCNLPAGTRYADMRAGNGHPAPYSDRVWCLGNEMDGEWQTGSRKSDDYADIARRAATVMKQIDPSIELVACGSSNFYMPTFGKWELAVLEAAYDSIDYISLHQYCANWEHDTASYLGVSADMNRFIKTAAAICDTVKGIKRSEKTVNLSFDEWNVWAVDRHCDNDLNRWTVAPRREEYIYSMEDALVFGCMMITLINNCDRVKMASLAQLVNVAAPIMTAETGDAWVQTTYYPFLDASNYGRGTVLRPCADCPSYHTEKYGEIPYLETAAVYNARIGEITVFAVNRSLTESCETELALQGFCGVSPIEHRVLTCADLDTCNTQAAPGAVSPVNAALPETDGSSIHLSLPAKSWNMLRFRVEA